MLPQRGRRRACPLPLAPSRPASARTRSGAARVADERAGRSALSGRARSGRIDRGVPAGPRARRAAGAPADGRALFAAGRRRRDRRDPARGGAARALRGGRRRGRDHRLQPACRADRARGRPGPGAFRHRLVRRPMERGRSARRAKRRTRSPGSSLRRRLPICRRPLGSPKFSRSAAAHLRGLSMKRGRTAGFGDGDGGDRSPVTPWRNRRRPSPKRRPRSRRPPPSIRRRPMNRNFCVLPRLMGALAYLRDLCGHGDGAEFRIKMTALLATDAVDAERRDLLAAPTTRASPIMRAATAPAAPSPTQSSSATSSRPRASPPTSRAATGDRSLPLRGKLRPKATDEGPKR